MPCTQPQAHITAFKLASAISDGLPLTGLVPLGPLPAEAMEIIHDLAAVLDEHIDERRRLARTPHTSTTVTTMMRRMQALQDFSAACRDAVSEPLERLELLGVGVEIHHCVVPVDPELDPDPDAGSARIGTELRFRPAHRRQRASPAR